MVTNSFAENAANLVTGTIPKERLPQVLNGFAVAGQQINLDQVDTKNFICKRTYSVVKYVHLDGIAGLLFSVNRRSYHLVVRDNKFMFTNKNLEQVNTLTSKEYRVEHDTEPIIINNNGITLDDPIIRFRGQLDNNNCIRWFPGSADTGQPRLEFSSFDRF